jgi:hypothetical protein
MASNIVIQAVNDTLLTLNINGELRPIQNEFDEIKALIQNLKIQSIQRADKIYNIEHINEANFGFLTGKIACYNQKLTKLLTEAAAPYSPAIKSLLVSAQNENPNWEQDLSYADKAREYLILNFVGVIGVQFRKLVAIGKEDDAPNKSKKYLNATVLLAQYGLDLLNFTLLASWWNAPNAQNRAFSPAHQKMLQLFLTKVVGLSIEQRLNLLETLLQMFEAQQINLPLPELTGFLENQLTPNTPFRQAVGALHQLKKRLDNMQFSPLDCADAEAQLATMYSGLAFLVRYKMASIKSVEYQQNKKMQPAYWHRYTALRDDDGKAFVDAEKIMPASEAVETNSIWIYNGKDYRNGINLMPFALDFNALGFEKGARIAFFLARDGHQIKYIFLHDQSSITIARSRILGDSTSSAWLMNNENRKLLNFNGVLDLLEQFQQMVGIENPFEQEFLE